MTQQALALLLAPAPLVLLLLVLPLPLLLVHQSCGGLSGGSYPSAAWFVSEVQGA
jgi:hypothetical protein